MEIAYVTFDDPRELRGWSGLAHYIGASLKPHGAHLHNFGPMKSEASRMVGVKRRFWKLFGRQILEVREPSLARGWARQIQGKLRDQQVDLILSTHTDLMAKVETDLPIVYWCDSNFGCMLNAYPYFQRLNPLTIARGHRWEKRSLERADLIIYACDWAKDSAVQNYGINPDKIKVIPFGANIQCDRTAADVDRLIAARPKEQCNLLFLGKVWARKGGDIAVAVAEELNRAGLPTTLTLIGSQPPEGMVLPPFVRKVGFINKSDPAGLKQFNDLIAQSHFLILPSRAEAFGIVFCEASSFGVPSLATRVGGIPSAIGDGVNGQTFELDASPAEYAAFVRQKFADYASYEALGRSSFREFETRLNWGVSGATAMGHIRAMLDRRGR